MSHDRGLDTAPLARILGAHPEVRLAYLFGSSARREARPGSDVDIALLAGPQFAREVPARLQDQLEGAVDGPVDLVLMNEASPLLLREIVTEGQLLVERDPLERAQFELRCTQVFLDTQHLRDLQCAYLRARVRPDTVLKPELVRKKLLDIEEAVGRLRSWMPVTLDRLEKDLQLQWAVERGLQVAAEALFDAGAHVLAGAFRETVERHADIPKRLAACGVLSPDTELRLRGLAGFRDVLVHDYADVDLRRVLEGLQRLDDFEAFVGNVSDWLEVRSSS